MTSGAPERFTRYRWLPAAICCTAPRGSALMSAGIATTLSTGNAVELRGFAHGRFARPVIDAVGLGLVRIRVRLLPGHVQRCVVRRSPSSSPRRRRHRVRPAGTCARSGSGESPATAPRFQRIAEPAIVIAVTAQKAFIIVISDGRYLLIAIYHVGHSSRTGLGFRMIARPALMPDRPVWRSFMDALSDVLRAVRLTGAFFFDVHALRAVVRGNPARQNRRRRDVSRLRSPHLLSPAHGRHVLGDASKVKSRSNYSRATSSAAARRHARARDRARHAQDARDVDVSHAGRSASCRRRFPSAPTAASRRISSADSSAAIRGLTTRC